MTEIMLYGALIIVAFMIFLKLRKKGFCMPSCRFPKKPVKSERDQKKDKKELKKRIERDKGKGVDDLDLFGDFIDDDDEKKGLPAGRQGEKE